LRWFATAILILAMRDRSDATRRLRVAEAMRLPAARLV
jgi:hypothetical protein